MLYTILYTTNPERVFSHDELVRLEKTSRIWNESHKVTGCLAYVEGILDGNTKCQIIQVLEGLKDDVENIFDSVKLDVRQRNVTLIKKGFIRTRKFNQWTMGYEKIQLSNNSLLQTFFALNHKVLSQEGNLEDNMLMTFMKLFCEQIKSLNCDCMTPKRLESYVYVG
jgi:hypothetical protein